jgi:hypothetical protein
VIDATNENSKVFIEAIDIMNVIHIGIEVRPMNALQNNI